MKGRLEGVKRVASRRKQMTGQRRHDSAGQIKRQINGRQFHSFSDRGGWQLRFSLPLFMVPCRSSGGEQSGLELKAAFSDTGSQQLHTLNWTSDEKWANFHHLT